MSHTPTPWTKETRQGVTSIMSGNQTVSKMVGFSAKREANADRIVLAVNNHDRLVESLERMLSANRSGLRHEMSQATQQARAALAAVRQEQPAN